MNSHVILKKDAALFVGNDGEIKNVVPTNFAVNTLLNTFRNSLALPDTTMILPDNCKGVFLGNKGRSVNFVIVQPPAYHTITLEGSLNTLNRNMFSQYKRIFPDETFKYKKTFRLFFPYMIFNIFLNLQTRGMSVDAFCRTKPLHSLEDDLFILPLTNFYSSQKVCMPGNYYFDKTDSFSGVCDNLTQAFWASTYNSDLVYNIDFFRNTLNNPDQDHLFQFAPFNYYVWEYWSKIKPANILSFEFKPYCTNLKRIFNDSKRGSDTRFSELTNSYKDFVDCLTPAYSEDDVFDATNFDKVSILGKITEHSYHFSMNKDLSLKIGNKFIIGENKYQVFCFITNNNSCRCACIVNDNPNIVEYFDDYRINNNFEEINKSLLTQENNYSSEFVSKNGKIIKSNEIIILNNKPTLPRSIFNYTFKNAFDIDMINTTMGNFINDGDIYALNELKGYSIYGKKITPNVYWMHFRKNTYTSTFILRTEGKITRSNFSQDIKSLELNTNSFSISLNDDYNIILEANKVKNNLFDLKTFSPHILLDRNTFMSLPKVYYATRTGGGPYEIGYLKKPIYVYINPENNKAYSLSKEEISYEKFKFSSKEYTYIDTSEKYNSVKHFEVGEHVISPKLEGEHINSTLYEIKKFITCVLDEDKFTEIPSTIFEGNPEDVGIFYICAELEGVHDSNEKNITPFIKFESNLTHGKIVFSGMRHACDEFKNLKVGELIKIDSSKFNGLKKSEVYGIKAIVTDSYPDALVLLSNNLTLWYRNIDEHFKKVLNKTPAVEDKLVNSDMNTSLVSNGTSFSINYKMRWGLPYPRVFKYQMNNDYFDGCRISKYHCNEKFNIF